MARIPVGDYGLAIRGSLSSKYPELATQPHHVAILKAFESGIPRTRDRGSGFTEVLQVVGDLNGSLCLPSSDEFVTIQGIKGWIR